MLGSRATRSRSPHPFAPDVETQIPPSRCLQPARPRRAKLNASELTRLRYPIVLDVAAPVEPVMPRRRLRPPLKRTRRRDKASLAMVGHNIVMPYEQEPPTQPSDNARVNVWDFDSGQWVSLGTLTYILK